jgi:DNA polymerase-3 subunit epsilon
MNFVAIDVETANSGQSSICQVGVVIFRDGKSTEEFESLVNPDDYFAAMNVAVHGISEKHVRDSPKFPAIHTRLCDMLRDQTVVSHTAFDRVAIARTSAKYGLQNIESDWINSARAVQRAWPQFARKGYGLKSIADFLNIKFIHHNAKEDARVAGEILIRAIDVMGGNAANWLSILKNSSFQSIDNRPIVPHDGDVLVFTGALQMLRSEAVSLATKVGFRVGNSVTKETTLLVVGDQDISKFAKGSDKSSKHQKAEELIAKGSSLRIIGESDFLQLIKFA